MTPGRLPALWNAPDAREFHGPVWTGSRNDGLGWIQHPPGLPITV